jgi:hypothetical protein
MKVKKYLDIRSNILKENRLLKFGIAVFALSAVISAVSAYRALHYSRTIFIPMTHANESFEVTGNRIDDAGIKMFVRYAFDLFLNYTPESAKAKFAEMVPMIHTRYYDEVSNELSRNLDTISRMKLVSSYQIEEIKINEIDHKIRVKGLRTRSTYGKQVDESVQEWELCYEIIDANFKIIRIQKLEGRG